MWHTSCCISLEVVLDYREFPDWLLFCCLTSCIAELAQQTSTHLTNTACSIFYYFFANRHSWSAELLGRIWCHGPKGLRGQVPFQENSGTHGNNVCLSLALSSHIGTMLGMADWKFTFDDKFVLLHIVKARYWMSQRVRNQQTHFWLALYNKSWNPMEAKRVNCL